LARPFRSPPTQILHQQTGCTPTRSRPTGTRTPKTPGTEPTLAQILRAQYLGLPRGYQIKYVAKALIATAGGLTPRELRPSHVTEVDQAIHNGGFALATKTYKANCLRQILRWLWEEHGAPKLDRGTTKYAGLRPRNVTVTDEEHRAILAAAPDYLRLWILLCSDLAIRSGTALILGPEHYDQTRHIFRFVTKKGAHQTMPTTDEIDLLLAECSMTHHASFVRQLHLRHESSGGRPLDPTSTRDDQLDRQWRELLRSVGITRRIVPHDLRRTAAVAMLEETGDIRDVQALLGHRSLQSTIWYLDHDLRPVRRETLERLKKPFLVRKERTA
jgi:hypothetical protein